MWENIVADPCVQTNPDLAQAAMNDPERFNMMVQQIEQSRRQAETQKSLQLAALNDDPFDVEAQKRIEEAIRQENIAANLEAAMEYNPESFARVRSPSHGGEQGDFHFEPISDCITIIRLLVYTYEWKSMERT
jgi:hypothetical protein